MAYGNKILTSIHGRRLGLQGMSSAESGGSYGPNEYAVGPDSFRDGVSTVETTATGESVPAYGVSYLIGTSVASTPVFILDPPIPGVEKTIVFGSTDSALYVKTKGGVADTQYIIGSSIGSTATCIRSSLGGAVQLVGLTTDLWAAVNVSSTAVNGVALQATT